MRQYLALALFPVIILGACGSKSESDKSEKVEISEIVSTTCTGLLTANTDSEASAVLQTGAALAEMIGVTNSQFGNYLQSTCSDAISYASNLP